jgi:hypothetical protein
MVQPKPYPVRNYKTFSTLLSQFTTVLSKGIAYLHWISIYPGYLVAEVAVHQNLPSCYLEEVGVYQEDLGEVEANLVASVVDSSAVADSSVVDSSAAVAAAAACLVEVDACPVVAALCPKEEVLPYP